MKQVGHRDSMPIHYIYQFADPRDDVIRYIGLGRDRRVNWWRRPDCDKQYGVHPWLRKLKSLGLNPVVSILVEGLTRPDASELEIIWIARFGRVAAGTGCLLNLSSGGTNGRGGCTQSAETRLKRSQAMKGRVSSIDTRRKISAAKRGKTPSNETRRKLSEAGKGKRRSSETRERMSRAGKGKVRSHDHCRHISEANKGRLTSDETRRKLSMAGKGRVQSIESRQKIAEKKYQQPPQNGRRFKGTARNRTTWRAKLETAEGPHTRYSLKTELEAAKAYNTLLDQFLPGVRAWRNRVDNVSVAIERRKT